MINWFLCWFFGHEPANLLDEVWELKVLLGEEDDEDISYITFCNRCDVILSYDPDLRGWVKW